MGVGKVLFDWRDRRYRLIQLRLEREKAYEDFYTRTKGLNRRSEEYESLDGDHQNAVALLSAEIGRLETLDLLRRAYRWRAPVPGHPVLPETENEHWAWNRVIGGYHLTTKGMREVRHAVAAEVDLYYKPWLSWAAIAISFLALIVSVFKP
ncbi:hypothetical protein [Neorhizobium sp. T25_13]|uniref:hypothetical protein n=1 Tax=Neorhizobium sp. T25_13 TaxID=2093830 RepID=UPI00155EC826|nr:hypothetical protein [Neorhizobium sp. T25_13]